MPVQKTPPFKKKINTGTLIMLGLFIGSFAGAKAINNKKEK